MSAALLSLREAAFRYGERRVFGGVDLDVRAGEVVSVLGINGCGKSTLLRCLGGLLPLAAGRAMLDGQDLGRLSPVIRARSIGFVFQAAADALPFTVRDVVQLGRSPHRGWLGAEGVQDAEVVEAAMLDAGVLDFAERPYMALSGGEQQLVQLARVLAQQPRVILMDEPTAHLDLRNQVRCLQLIASLAARGVAVVVSTHDPNHAFVLGGSAVLMKDGTRPVAGPVAEQLTPERLSDIYGIPITVHAAPSRTDGLSGPTWCSPW